MVLKKIRYSQFEGTDKEWKLEDFSLGKINLIVGKNASGKTMTLNVISNACNFFLHKGELMYEYGNFDITFEDKEVIFNLILKYNKKEVESEQLRVSDKLLLERDKDGIGKIWYEKIRQSLDFEIPKHQLAFATKRDIAQHPFLESLYEWATNLRKFDFGSDFGRNSFLNKTEFEKNEVNFADTQNVTLPVYKLAKEEFESFDNILKEDFKIIGYDILDIKTLQVGKATFHGFALQQDIYGLAVKENGLNNETTQQSISQGMYRALSLLIQLNYYFLTQKEGCIIIDDIGEGLDFERSKALIKLLIEKAENSNIQLIMSTNDRFVMNNVPLEYWAIIHREGSVVKIINYDNSKDIFDKFEYTGLDNFDFFTSKYYLNQVK